LLNVPAPLRLGEPSVSGVQTCWLPISAPLKALRKTVSVTAPALLSVRVSRTKVPDSVELPSRLVAPAPLMVPPDHTVADVTATRSEERRVGEARRYGGKACESMRTTSL